MGRYSSNRHATWSGSEAWRSRGHHFGESHTGNLEPWVVLGGLCLGGGMLLIALWFFCFRD
jgi:hypothetical protein